MILEQFRNRELDEVYVVYTRMENSVQAEAEVMKLLPLERSDFGEMKMPLNMYREDNRTESITDGGHEQYCTKLYQRYDLWCVW